MSGFALILAGHGSHISANTAGIVWNYVDRLRRQRVADEITACFWKEQPAFSQVLDTVEAEDVIIVPVFTAKGYFAGEVIPAEFRLDGELTIRGDRRIHLTPTVGEHPQLRSIVETRLRETVEQYGLPPADTAAAIIGHGTRRNRNSRDTAHHQAERIHALDWLSEVVDVYLDDEPDIPSVYRNTRAANIIALPYFLAGGSHVTHDVPRALGISELESVNHVNGRSVFYCEPVGSDETICQVILELARDAGLPLAPSAGSGAWTGFPRAGRSVLLQALESGRILRFGQISVSKTSVRHSDASSDSKGFASPAALRAYLRDDPFRPLATSADLPGGWHVNLAQPEGAHAVLETVYPGLIADWAAKQCGALKTESLRDIGTRQNGLFRDIHKLPKRVIKTAMDKICGNCIRQPVWWPGFQETGDQLPCPSACNLWLSSARQLGDAAT